jgi:sugar diacid utilization regulator
MLLQSIASTISALVSSKELLHKAILSAHIPLLENILYGQYASGEIAHREAANLGWDLNADHVVAIFEIASFDQYIIKHQFAEPQINKMRANFIKTMSEKIMGIQGIYPLKREDLTLTTILRLSNKISLSRIEQCCQEIVDFFKEQYDIEAYVGISSVVKDLSGFCNRLSEAGECIKIAKTLKKSRVAKYDALSMEIILYKILRNPEIQQNYLSKLKLLVEYDQQYHSNIIETLQSYVINQGNLALTSRNLNIHRNTVKYRLKKAEELLDIQIGTTGTFLTLAVLLKIYEINKTRIEQ